MKASGGRRGIRCCIKEQRALAVVACIIQSSVGVVNEVAIITVIGGLHGDEIAVVIIGVLEGLFEVAHRSIFALLFGHIAMLIVFGRDLTALTKIISGLVVARALVIHNVICTIFADSFDVQAIDIHGIEIAGRGLDTAIIRDNFRDGQLMGIIIGIGGGVVQILLTITYGVGLFAQFPAVVIIGVLAHDGRIAILIIAFNHVPVVVENLSVQIVLLAIEVGGHFQDIAVLVQLFDDNGVHIISYMCGNCNQTTNFISKPEQYAVRIAMGFARENGVPNAFDEVRHIFGYNNKYGVDFVDNTRKVCMEYNGVYWHKDKKRVDCYKFIKIHNAGYTFIRILEPGLKAFDKKYDIVLPKNYKHGNEYESKIMEDLGYKLISLFEEIYNYKATPEIQKLVDFKEFEKWYDIHRKRISAKATDNAAKKAA